jgi:hypothetical protein
LGFYTGGKSKLLGVFKAKKRYHSIFSKFYSADKLLGSVPKMIFSAEQISS